MNARLGALLAVLLLAGCSGSAGGDARDELIAADRAFCAKAAKDGIPAAFTAFSGRDVKLLSETAQGAEGIRTLTMQLPPKTKLTWTTSFADVARSGDLGYTWGRYVVTLPASKPGTPDAVRMGTYVTVWRKIGGAWKVVLDGGNPDGGK